MAAVLPNLHSEFRIGNCTVRNRIVSTGHHTYLTDHVPSNELIAYHEARAKGGAGLIISEIVAVHESAGFSGKLLTVQGKDDIGDYARLVDACHRHGAKIFAQLFHPGREILSTSDGMLPIAYAPSAVPNERFHIMPKPMPVDLIKDIVIGYGKVASMLAEAGFDGFEIVGSHGYLPAQFLGTKTNLRDDEYGGSFENRLRFVREVVEQVRLNSADRIVGLRLSGSELDDTGMDDAEVLQNCRALGPDLDYLSVVAGTSATLGGSVHITPPMGVEHGYIAPFAQKIRQATGKPVIATGRINQPQIAEQIIADGAADLCGMTRALICDPEMPVKSANGKLEDIRACIGCNQACIGRAHKGIGISCIQHPETGRELEYGQLAKCSDPKRVLVVGGGPAGMKAAATAASRGHKTLLYEADKHLGGQAKLARLLPGREEFGGIIDNLQREMDIAGVEIETGIHVSPELISDVFPDQIILATGSIPYQAKFEGYDYANVVSAWDVLTGTATIGSRVVIADWRADWIGIGLAEMLSKNGCHVTLCSNAAMIGETLQMYTRNHYHGRLHKLGVNIRTHARIYGFDEDTAYFQDTLTGEPVIIDEVDTLVCSLGTRSEDRLGNELEARGIPIYSIGDCVTPRTAEEAVFEGLTTGWQI
ncbi:MAG: FAD-dependent oxidoreductase [Pseudomonadota bacterium]